MKTTFKPGTMEAPLPAVMVSCGYGDEDDIITVAWTGIVCSDPPRTYISIRPERHSYPLIDMSGEFVINLVPQELAKAMDRCGCTTGAKVDKWKENGLTKERGDIVSCPMISQSPVNLECKVFDILHLGSHDMFLADIVSVHVDDAYINESGRIEMEEMHLVSLIHGSYYAAPGKRLGKMGYSVMKKSTRRRLAGAGRGGSK